MMSPGSGGERVFPQDVLSKRERVERTLNHQPLDRAPLLEQLSHNPDVIALYTGKQIEGFDYTVEDIGCVIRQTMDMCMPVVAPRGTGRITTPDGFVRQYDNWYSSIVSRPFSDAAGARDWLQAKLDAAQAAQFDAAAARQQYTEYMGVQQDLIGETVLMGFSSTGMESIWTSMGLQIFSFFYHDYPELLSDWLELTCDNEVKRVHAVASRELSPVVLVPEDCSSKTGPIFPPSFMERYHYPNLTRLVEAWHDHDIKVLYHTDGNYNALLPDLIDCGFDGFYCLEPAADMKIVELRKQYPQMVWAGGVDGVDLMERGTPEQVRAEVRRQITQTDVLEAGGMFVASSSEINPPIKPENFQAMVEAVGELCNPDFTS